MNDQVIFHQFVSQSFTHDIAAATYLLETLPEEEAAVILQALPLETAVRAIRNLQIGFAAGIVVDRAQIASVLIDIDAERVIRRVG